MRTASIIVLISACTGLAQADTTLYSQPNNQPTNASFFSDGVSGQFFSQRMADNFTLSSGGSVTGVKWWGASQNYQYADLTNMTGFVVQVLADDGFGSPDGLNVLYSQTFTKAQTSPTATGFTAFGGGTQYQFQATLSSPLTLSAGTQYWVSIGAVLSNPFADAWVWNHSSVGDGKNASNYFNNASYYVYSSGDMAFELVGNVPAPSALALIGLGGLAAGRRRR